VSYCGTGRPAFRMLYRVSTVHRLWTTILLLASCVSTKSVALYAAETSAAPFTGVSLNALPLEPSARHEIEISLKLRDYAGAEGTLLRAVSEHPNEPLLYTYLGRLFLIDHKYLNTAIAMKKAEALQPLEERDRFTLAMAYVEIGHPDWARPELEKLAQLSPQNPLYPYWQGRLDYDRQNLVAAIVQFEKVIALDADYMKAYDNLGLCLEGVGKYDEAIEQYRRAIQLNRERNLNSSWPSLDLGALLIKLDRLDEAQPLLKESLQFNPNFAQAHYQLGVLMEKHNEVTPALQELNRAAVLDEADPQPHYVLARVYRRAGNDEQSRRELQIFQSLKSKESSPRSE
jgi:tetratricopeptide (TPR) repeat protein